jgi:hypothetical protein
MSRSWEMTRPRRGIPLLRQLKEEGMVGVAEKKTEEGVPLRGRGL